MHLPAIDRIISKYVDPKRLSNKKHCRVIYIPVQFSDSVGPVSRPVYWFYDKEFMEKNLKSMVEELMGEGIPVVVK